MKKLTKRQVETLVTVSLAFLSCIGTYLALVPNERWKILFEYMKPGEVFTIRPTNWQNVGIYITSSQTVEITYERGRWKNCQGCPETDAGGIFDELYLPESNSANIIYGCPHGALIARTVENIGDVELPIGEPDYFSQNNIICIGNSFIGTFPLSGYLQLTSNDRFSFDSDGSLVIRVDLH